MKNLLRYLVLSAVVFAIPACAIDFTQFHTPAQMDSELTNLVNTHPSLAQIFTIGNSVEGRPIRGIKISTNPGVDDPAKQDVIFVGLHHAREWISAEMALYLADYLLANFNSNQSLQACLNNLQVWIIPVLNPDGYAYTATVDRYWRKNRRNNGDGTFGVDLNRNYGFQWGLNSGSSGVTSDDTYRGPSPFSEPETAALRDFVLARHNPRAFMTYHSFSELFLRPWSYTTSDPPGVETLSYIVQDSIARIAAVHGLTYGPTIWYTSSGEATDYLWNQLRIAAFTTELRPASSFGLQGFSPAPSEIIPNNEENLPAALALIRDAGCRKLWVNDDPPDNGTEPSAVWLGNHWSQPFWTSTDISANPDPPPAGGTAVLSVQVRNASGSPMQGSIVRAYYTDPRVSLEFPNPTATLIGEQTVNVPPSGKTVTFNWNVPAGANSWGENHWCVGAVVMHPDDRPLSTQIQLSNNVGGHNFQTAVVQQEATLFVAITNLFQVAAEYEVAVDPRVKIPEGWEVRVPHMEMKTRKNRKALLLQVKGNVLEPGETVLQPIHVRLAPGVAPGAGAELRLNGVLRPLVAGKRSPAGNGYTFRLTAGACRKDAPGC